MFIQKKSIVLLALTGICLLGGGEVSKGAVVTVATPADLVPATTPLADPGINVLWDLNGDGANDFNFTFRQPQINGDVDWQANAFPLNGAKVIGTFDTANDVFFGNRLTAGTSIGSASVFTGPPAQAILGENFAGTTDGQFVNTAGYLGFSLTVGANLYYGYLNLSTARTGGIDFISAAYENTSGSAIAAGAVPEPGAWAMLGLGSVAGLAGLRRRRAIA